MAGRENMPTRTVAGGGGTAAGAGAGAAAVGGAAAAAVASWLRASACSAITSRWSATVRAAAFTAAAAARWSITRAPPGGVGTCAGGGMRIAGRLNNVPPAPFSVLTDARCTGEGGAAVVAVAVAVVTVAVAVAVAVAVVPAVAPAPACAKDTLMGE